MENNALVKMAQDMQIEQYAGETQSNYAGRIIYSALCHWMRYVVMDETTQKHDRKSKAYVLGRIKELLVIMSEAFPVSKGWIFRDLKNPVDDDELIRELRDKMLAARELLEVDESRNIGLPAYEKNYCTDDYDRITGLSEEIGSTEYVGITRVVRKKHETKNRGLENKIDINDYIDWIYVGASWNECHNIEAFEFFNPFSKRPPYQSWTNAVPCNEKSILARLTLYKGLHEYHLIKKENDIYKNAPITNVLAEWKEERRVLLALRKKVGNAMQATYDTRDSVYLLNLYCGLPLREQVLIDTYCWPLNSMDDKYNYVVPEFIWEDIKSMIIDGLGIDLKEKN